MIKMISHNISKNYQMTSIIEKYFLEWLMLRKIFLEQSKNQFVFGEEQELRQD